MLEVIELEVYKGLNKSISNDGQQGDCCRNHCDLGCLRYLFVVLELREKQDNEAHWYIIIEEQERAIVCAEGSVSLLADNLVDLSSNILKVQDIVATLAKADNGIN